MPLLLALLLAAAPEENTPYEVGLGTHYGIFLSAHEDAPSVDVLAAMHFASVFAIRVRAAYALTFIGMHFDIRTAGPFYPVVFAQAVPDLRVTVCRTPRSTPGVQLECWLAVGAGATAAMERNLFLAVAPSASAETGFDVRLPFLPDVYVRLNYGIDLVWLPGWPGAMNNRFAGALLWRYGAEGL